MKICIFLLVVKGYYYVIGVSRRLKYGIEILLCLLSKCYRTPRGGYGELRWQQAAKSNGSHWIHIRHIRS